MKENNIPVPGRCAPPDMLLKVREIFQRPVSASSVSVDLPRLVKRIELKNEKSGEIFTLENEDNRNKVKKKKKIFKKIQKN